MLIVDLIAGAALVAMVAWGAWAGLSGTMALAGFAAGALAGAVVAPLVLQDGNEDEFALVFALPAALFLGALLAAVIERRTVRLRRRLHRRDRLDPVSAIGGALLGAWIGVVALWLLGTIVVQVGTLRDAVQDSAIVSRLDAVLTPPGPGPGQENRPFDPFPVVAGPGPPIAPLDPDVVDDPQVRIADRSVVKIGVLTLCGAGGGSGWIGADGIVVTNAHVAAAADAVTVRIRGVGPAHPATPIWFDPVNDVALLRAPALEGVPALPIARRPRPGTAGAALGFPGLKHAILPARIGKTTSTLGGRMTNLPPKFPLDLRGRLVTSFRGDSRPGSSGGPVVDTRGRVLTTVFAGRGTQVAGFGVPNRFVRSALRLAGPPVDTGPCRSADADDREQ